MARDNSRADTKPVPVVTAFLWDGQSVLLAQRSAAVSTFPGHWAGISGYLEGDDAAAWALVEIGEECGLARHDVVLRSVGEPLVAGQPNVVAGLPTEPPVRGQETRAQQEARQPPHACRVHPFLFSTHDRDRIRRDWEAQRFDWVPTDEMLDGVRQPAVPRLYDAFTRVWPPWPTDQAIDANVRLAESWLRADRSMGAGMLARAAAREIVKLLPVAGHDFGRLRQQLVDVAERLRFARPSMVPPINLLADVRDAIAGAADADDAEAAAAALVSQSEKAERAAVTAAAGRIGVGERVMTISYSGTVRQVLLAAAAKIGRVVVCESRPLYEGRTLAEALEESDLAVTVITDAQAAAHVDRVDRVLLGADAVLPDGSVVNKVGSTLLALAAQRAGKPVTVVADSLKRVRDPGDYRFTPEENPASEVWPDAPQGIEVANEYFERVPAELIDEVVGD